METARIYQQTYGVPYASAGCSYRGEHPRHTLKEETDDQRTLVSAGVFDVCIDQLRVCIITGNILASWERHHTSMRRDVGVNLAVKVCSIAHYT